MADFSTEAEVSIVVPRRELRSARQEVEEALADIPVGMSASGGGSGGGTNAAREQRRRRREFRWARQRTDDTEAQLEILENIEGELTEGGLGGGGIAGELIGLGGDTAGIATDIGSTIVEALPSALGSLAGTALGQQVGGGGGGGGSGELSLERPEWIPVQTDRPEWIPLAVEEPGDGILPDIDLPEIPTIEFDTTPGPIGFEDPPTAPVGDPPTVPIEDPPTLPIGEPPTVPIEDPPTLKVEKPEWVPLEVMPPDRQDSGRRTDERQRRGILERAGGALDTIGGQAVNAIPGVNQPGLTQPLSQGGSPIQRPFESIGRVLDAPGREIANLATRQGRQSNALASSKNISASTGDVNVTVNADIQSAVQEAIDGLRREQERQREELRRELENKINDLERQISNTGGGGGQPGGPLRR